MRLNGIPGSLRCRALRPYGIADILLCAAAVGVAGACCPQVRAGAVTPERMTENIMELFSDALQRYAAANGKLPDTLHALPLREDIRAWIWKDGWGEAIRYEHNGNGGYTLSSSLPFRPGSAASVAVPVVDPADDDTSMDVSNTIANMELLDVAISRYLKQTGHLPAKLSDLPEPASIGVPYETTDGWGGPISYAKDSDENFELSAIRTTAAGRQYHFSRKDVEVRGTTEPTTMRGGQ